MLESTVSGSHSSTESDLRIFLMRDFTLFLFSRLRKCLERFSLCSYKSTLERRMIPCVMLL